MRSLFLLPACAALCVAQAQQIDGYRYWFDDDDANIVTTSVGATPELVLVATWPTTGLAPGFHNVSFQVRDTNGDWSVPHSTLFTRSAADIVGYRFWVNDDAANLVTGTVGPNAVVDLNGVIDPGTLPKDYNTVTIQFRDADAEWSVPTTSVFVKNAGAVSGYEYWIDDDIAARVSGSIGPAGVVDLVADLATGTTPGAHLFTIRFSGTNGTWSVPLTTEFSFFTGLEELPGVSDLLLFPNPATDGLGLRMSTDGARAFGLQVLDLKGAVVMDLGTWSANGTTSRNWDISDLASGSYQLRMSDGQGTWSTRFVKQ